MPGPAPTLEVGNLKKFTQMNQIKRAALTVIATQLPGARIEELKKSGRYSMESY